MVVNVNVHHVNVKNQNVENQKVENIKLKEEGKYKQTNICFPLAIAG